MRKKFYTDEVAEQLEKIVTAAKQLMQDLLVFDYTKWQCEHFDNVDPDEFLETAYVYDKTHPIR